MTMQGMMRGVPPVLLMLVAAACEDAPVSPSTAPKDAGAPSFTHQGNSRDIVRQCRDHYQELYRTDGTGFADFRECIRYAAVIGTLATRLTATFTNVVFNACNELSWGWLFEDGVLSGAAGSKPYGCGVVAGRDTFVTYLSTQQTPLVYLRDHTCDDLYLEGLLHSRVTGTNPGTVQITDSGGFCESDPSVPRPPENGGNLSLVRTITEGWPDE